MVILIILLVVFILTCWVGWTHAQKRAEIEYMDLYFEIIGLIELPVTYENYSVVHKKFVELSKLRYKNKEKTSVLYNNFMRKFKSVAK